MDVRDKSVLVLGADGQVGSAVCRALLPLEPAVLVAASLKRAHAERTAAALKAAGAGGATRILAGWGDVFLAGEWQSDDAASREDVLADPDTRRRLMLDILDPLDEAIFARSRLSELILGEFEGLSGRPADIVIDCINTATAVSYQNVFQQARRLADLTRAADPVNWPVAVETLIASLYVPQLVRHVQLLYEAMRRAGTTAYLKIGTAGTGGMGFNIPYTHGEERPSRLLLSKSAMAGAQTLLIFAMARTPGAPRIVKEIKPTALIGWKEVAYGPIQRRGRPIELWDCPPDMAVSAADPASRAAQGDFGVKRDGVLEGAYIDTGENGLFSAGEFTAITALHQMELVTPEEIATNVVREITGESTGRDVVGALDGAVMEPSFRGGILRAAAIEALRRLEREEGEAVAFEILGPPRLSKLLFEAYLLKHGVGTIGSVLAAGPADLSARLGEILGREPDLRQRIVSIGLPVLLGDGARLLRGPQIKSDTAEGGWVDLTEANMAAWQTRLRAFDAYRANVGGDDTSSGPDRAYAATAGAIEIGEVVAWIFTHEDAGARAKP
jgi:NAD(P)-dependent dehydrogenase (short-subunit alcohol dehydrogenase family)